MPAAPETRAGDARRAAAPRRAAGRDRRADVPRSSHAGWVPPADRADPVALLETQNRRRVPELVPLRWQRMLASPFGFLRGAAVVMAHDLATTPKTGIMVQACGDAHVANFGVFATPERQLIFDVTDFDETLSAPWEWDVKRLAASAVVAGRDAGIGESACLTAAETGVREYRKAMLEFAETTALGVWYSRVDEHTTSVLRHGRSPAQLEQLFTSARRQTSQTALPALTELTKAGSWRIVDHPPLVTHDGIAEHRHELERLVRTYRDTLTDDRRVLLERFELRDFARKAVGVGSVGTRCYVALLVSDMDEPLFLQVKEADRSVLAPWGGRWTASEGRRVVAGQRIMQADSDIFLGWAEAEHLDFYVRQLRDMKGSANFATMRAGVLADYLRLCGWTLARAHARGGAAAEIAGYLGKGVAFDRALTRFSVAYADQTTRDHAALVDAERSGRIHAAS